MGEEDEESRLTSGREEEGGREMDRGGQEEEGER